MSWYRFALKPQMSVQQALQVFGFPIGVRPNPDQIRSRYRELVLKSNHGDLGSRGGTVNIVELNKAHEVLKGAAFDFIPQSPSYGHGTRTPPPGAKVHEYGTRSGQDESGHVDWGDVRSRYGPKEKPPWQTDDRSSSSFNEKLGRKDVNYCKKEIYEAAIKHGNVEDWYFMAFDGHFFRGSFTAKCNSYTLGLAGEIMEHWNSLGANPYPTAAVVAKKGGSNVWLVIRIKGQDSAGQGIRITNVNGINDNSFVAQLKKILGENGQEWTG